MKYNNNYIQKISTLRHLPYDKTKEILDTVADVVNKFMPILDAEILLENKFSSSVEIKCALTEYHKHLGWHEMAKWFINKQKKENNINDLLLFSTYKEKDKINVH